MKILVTLELYYDEEGEAPLPQNVEKCIKEVIEENPDYPGDIPFYFSVEDIEF